MFREQSQLASLQTMTQRLEGFCLSGHIQGTIAVGSKCLIFGLLLALHAVTAEPVADDSAKALLERVRENRETLSPDFPGFQSRLVVHSGGRVYEGRMHFRPPITLEVEFSDTKVRKKVKPLVRSLLSHRMRSDGLSDETVRFAEPDEHPLGRRILLGDKYRSSYRIRDGGILEVDRNMEDSRLVISVLETMTTASGTNLPVHFFVTVFDKESGAVKSASAYRDVYEQIEGEYLPRSRYVINTAEGRTDGLLVEWEEIELLSPVRTD